MGSNVISIVPSAQTVPRVGTEAGLTRSGLLPGKPVSTPEPVTVSKSIAEHKAKASDAGQLDRAVRREVDRLSKMVEHTQPRIRIEYNPDAKIVVVQMVDPNDPSKVLRSFPSDEFVKMMASMRNPSGLIVNGQG